MPGVTHQEAALRFLLGKLANAGYTGARFGFEKPAFGRVPDSREPEIELWMGPERQSFGSLNALQPLTATLAIECYVARFARTVEDYLAWVATTTRVAAALVDSPQQAQWCIISGDVTIDRQSALRRWDSGAQVSNGWAVARIDLACELRLYKAAE